VTDSGRDGLLAGLFDRGGAPTGDAAWLQAMLDAEAALARALERAGLAAQGSGAAVTAAARADQFDPAELGRQAVRTGNPVPALVRALSAQLPPDAREAVHRGATSQDIIDTAAMLIARRVLDAIIADLQVAAGTAADLAEQHVGTVMAGRTLLQQAVPVTFGLVAAGWLKPGSRFSSAGRPARSRRSGRPGRPSPRCSPRKPACRSRSCPGIPTGSGSCGWPPR
jgi:3-carboxy-cis,cis-muconate cycloisomerase